MSEIPNYDIFLSYANEDRALAQRLHQLLAVKGFVSSFEDIDNSNKNSRDKIFEAVFDSAVCVLIIGSRKQSPWWDNHICEAIKERVSTSHGEYRVVSILSATPQQHLQDLSFQLDWGFQSEGRIHYTDVIDDAEKWHELIRFIRGADRRHSLLAKGETRKWATMRAKNALDVDWEKLYSVHRSQSKPQPTRLQSLKTKEHSETVERRKRFHEKAQEYLKILTAFATRVTNEPELAQEIVQQAMVHYLSLREADNWQQDIQNEVAYLFKIVSNLLKDEWRTQSKTTSVSLDQPPDDQLRKDLSQLTDSFDVEKQLYLEERLQTIPLKTILGRLSEQQRRLLYLRAVEELTYDEIAKEVNYDPIIVRYELQKTYATVRARVKKMSASYSAVGLGRAIEKCERFRGSNQFVTDQEPIKHWLEDKLSDEVHAVSTPKALTGGLYKVGENHCNNLHKHSKVVKRHEEFVSHTAIAGKRNSIPIAISGSSTPKEDLIDKEEAPLWETRKLDTCARVRRVLTEDVIIASRWGRGQKPQDIAVELNKSAATVYRKLAMMQKAVIREIGLIETEENKGLIKAGLRELFAHSLEGMVTTIQEGRSKRPLRMNRGST